MVLGGHVHSHTLPLSIVTEAVDETQPLSCSSDLTSVVDPGPRLTVSSQGSNNGALDVRPGAVGLADGGVGFEGVTAKSP